jgi:uncharacterized membrane protein
MISESMLFMICATIVVISAILGITVFNIQENNLKSKNIESAITKGIDPLSVRCSYANSQDLLCVAYASSKK